MWIKDGVEYLRKRQGSADEAQEAPWKGRILAHADDLRKEGSVLKVIIVSATLRAQHTRGTTMLSLIRWTCSSRHDCPIVKMLL